jgi:hypothetical protein
MAGDFAMTGENIVVASNPTIEEQEDGSTYMHLSDSHVLRTGTPGDPFDKATMNCAGSCLVAESGDGTCLGSCSGRDRDGELFLFTWDGFVGGGWELTGGTGKWADSKGSGTWEAMAPLANGMGMNSWEGTVTLK